jgi:hypothetical protein
LGRIGDVRATTRSRLRERERGGCFNEHIFLSIDAARTRTRPRVAPTNAIIIIIADDSLFLS